MFFDNYIIQCNLKGKTPTACALEMGFARSEVTRWKQGSTPRNANLVKIANYFGCTTEDLLAEKEPAQSSGLTKSQRELIRLIPSLSEQELAVLSKTAKALIDNRL